MSADRDEPEWYLEGPGQTRVGPYTIEQLKTFRRDAKISDESRVTSTYLGNQWITLLEILGAKEEPSKSFSPPPRPEIERTSTALLYNKQRSNINSAVTLLDTLHAARDRKPKVEIMGAIEPTNHAAKTSKLILLPVALIAIAGLSWILFSNSEPSKNTKTQTKAAGAGITESAHRPEARAETNQPPAASPPAASTALIRNRPLMGGAIRLNDRASARDNAAPAAGKQDNYHGQAPANDDRYDRRDDRRDDSRVFENPRIENNTGPGLGNEPAADALDERPADQQNPPPPQFE